MSEFYITLASNSSMDYYKDNKTSNFTVQLPKTLTLDGKWKVALAEIYYQNTFHNVSEGSNLIGFRFKSTSKSFEMFDRECLQKFSIKINTYKNIEELLYAINWTFMGFISKNTNVDDTNSLLKYNERSGKVLVTEVAKKVFSDIYFNNRLAVILGFNPDQNAVNEDDEENIRTANLSFGIPDNMLVYCDIIDPQLFAHTTAKVMRVVNIDKKNKDFGEACHKEFQRLQYLPILKKEFENISIELRDKTGMLMPFEYGTSMIVLHFIKN